MSVLLQMSAHASVLICLTVLLRALWLEKLPKRTFTALWLVAAVRMVLPLSFTVPAPAAPVSAVYHAVAQAVPMPAPAAEAPFPWMAALWLLGAAACAGVLLGGHILSLCRYREALPLHDPAVDRLCRDLVPHRAVSVRLCQGLGTPLTYGFFRPVILLPSDLDWADRRQLGYILAHELTHIRRFHIPFKYLLTAAVCLHWFNPLAWLMYILAGRDIELCCDEAVLRRTRDGRAGYAMTLIGLEERRALSPLSSGFGAKAVRERIRQIMLFRPAGAVGLTAAAVLVLSSVTVFAAAAEAGPQLSEAFSGARLSAAYASPEPTPYETAVPVLPTEEPAYNYVNLTPEPTGAPAPTDTPATPLYEAPIMARPTPEEPAATDPSLVEPSPPPVSTSAPMEAEATPEPTVEPTAPPAVPTPSEPTASPAPWNVEVLPTPVTGGLDPSTPLPPDAPFGPTPAPMPQALYPTPEPVDLPS